MKPREKEIAEYKEMESGDRFFFQLYIIYENEII